MASGPCLVVWDWSSSSDVSPGLDSWSSSGLDANGHGGGCVLDVERRRRSCLLCAPRRDPKDLVGGRDGPWMMVLEEEIDFFGLVPEY